MSIPPESLSSRLSDDLLAINANWLMKLRWVAVVGQLATILVVAYGFGVHIELSALLIALTITTITTDSWTVRISTAMGRRHAVS